MKKMQLLKKKFFLRREDANDILHNKLATLMLRIQKLVLISNFMLLRQLYFTFTLGKVTFLDKNSEKNLPEE